MLALNGGNRDAVKHRKRDGRGGERATVGGRRERKNGKQTPPQLSPLPWGMGYS